MFSKKFNIIRISIIVVAALALGYVWYASRGTAKDAEIAETPETIIEKTKTYISNNKEYFNEISEEDDLEFRISTKELINKGYLEEDTSLKGYVKIVNDEYSFVEETSYLVNKIIKDENVVEETSNEGMPFDVKYVYKGEPNNYIKYKDKIYRIMSVTNSNYLKLISVERDNIKKWGSTGNINYFDEKIKEEPIGTKGIFYVGYVRSENSNIDQILKNEKRNNEYTKVTPKYYGYSSYINVSDIVNASNECEFKNITDINNQNCKSYIFDMIGDTYSCNTAENSNVYYVDNNKIVKTKELQENIYVNRVIYLQGLNKYNGGDGTLDNPYIYE